MFGLSINEQDILKRFYKALLSKRFQDCIEKLVIETCIINNTINIVLYYIYDKSHPYADFSKVSILHDKEKYTIKWNSGTYSEQYNKEQYSKLNKENITINVDVAYFKDTIHKRNIICGINDLSDTLCKKYVSGYSLVDFTIKNRFNMKYLR